MTDCIHSFVFKTGSAVAASVADSTVRLLPVWNGVILGADVLSKADASALESWRKKAAFTGEAATIAWPQGLSVPVLLAGMGMTDDFQMVRWFRGFAAAGCALADSVYDRARIDASILPAISDAGVTPASVVRRMVEGLVFGPFRFTRFRRTAPAAQRAARTMTMELAGDAFSTPALRAAVEAGRLTAATLNEVRDSANLPANWFGPADLAAYARHLAARTPGLSCKVWDAAALRREKAGALLAVGQGSRRPPCLIRVAYTPSAAAAKARPARVLVGKAILFDAGGICLKPPKGMEWMQYDKCGGMTVLATVLLAARLRLPRPVIAYIPAAENLPGGNAQRPGDLVIARNGKSIEVLNTDAEGRLILADALTFAADEHPEAIVDVATLTGAVVLALGHEATGVMSSDTALLRALGRAGDESGERLWPLPMWEEYEAPIRGTFGDLRNMGAPGAAGTIAGAVFLQQFVPPEIPWAHLDVAGTAWTETPLSWCAPGATLSCARLLTAWLEEEAALPSPSKKPPRKRARRS